MDGRTDVFIITSSSSSPLKKWPSGVSRCELRREVRKEKEKEEEEKGDRHDTATHSIRRPLFRELFQGCPAHEDDDEASARIHNASSNERPIRHCQLNLPKIIMRI